MNYPLAVYDVNDIDRLNPSGMLVVNHEKTAC